MFTLEKELLGKQGEAPKDGKNQESHGLAFSKCFGREVRTSIEEKRGLGTAVKFGKY